MKITDDKKREILDLLKSSCSLKDICTKTGVSKPTVIKIRKEYSSSRSSPSRSESSRSDSSQYTEISESVTLGTDDTRSESSRSNSSVSSQYSETNDRVFIQQRAFTEMLGDSGKQLKSIGVESWRVGDRVDDRVGDRELEEFRLSLLGKTDLGKVEESKSKVEESKSKVEESKSKDNASKSKVDSKADSKVDNTKVNICAGERKEALVSKIALYIETFPQKLGQLTQGKHDVNGYLRSLNLEDLEKLLGQVRYRCSNAGITDSCTLAFQTMAGVVEQVGCKAGLKLQGYAASLAQNQQARECLSELTIEYLSEVAITPQRRLIMICLMQGYTIHSSNSLEDKSKSLLDEKIDPSLV